MLQKAAVGPLHKNLLFKKKKFCSGVLSIFFE